MNFNYLKPKQMTQTAVDWLFFMLNNPNRDQEFANKLLDKAKEIEKDQIIDAYSFGYTNGFDDAELNTKVDDAEQYYNQTYKQ